MNLFLIAFHAITLFSLCSLFGIYVLLIAFSGDESWWLLLVIFAFITVDFVVALIAIKFLRSLIAFDKTLTPDSELIVDPSAHPSRAQPLSTRISAATRAITSPSRSSANTSNSNNASRNMYATAAIEQRLVDIERLDCRDAPNQFLCPISLTVMVDPVVAIDGHTYERMNIMNWFKANKTSPMTRQAMKTSVVPNQAIKSQICEYLERKQQEQTLQEL